jgi:hypothetical protein
VSHVQPAEFLICPKVVMRTVVPVLDFCSSSTLRFTGESSGMSVACGVVFSSSQGEGECLA